MSRPHGKTAQRPSVASASSALLPIRRRDSGLRDDRCACPFVRTVRRSLRHRPIRFIPCTPTPTGDASPLRARTGRDRRSPAKDAHRRLSFHVRAARRRQVPRLPRSDDLAGDQHFDQRHRPRSPPGRPTRGSLFGATAAMLPFAASRGDRGRRPLRQCHQLSAARLTRSGQRDGSGKLLVPPVPPRPVF